MVADAVWGVDQPGAVAPATAGRAAATAAATVATATARARMGTARDRRRASASMSSTAHLARSCSVGLAGPRARPCGQRPRYSASGSPGGVRCDWRAVPARPCVRPPQVDRARRLARRLRRPRNRCTQPRLRSQRQPDAAGHRQPEGHRPPRRSAPRPGERDRPGHAPGPQGHEDHRRQVRGRDRRHRLGAAQGPGRPLARRARCRRRVRRRCPRAGPSATSRSAPRPARAT